MTPPFVELDLQLLNISIANTKYKKMDLFPFNFYSLTNIANVAVQVIANAQTRESGNQKTAGETTFTGLIRQRKKKQKSDSFLISCGQTAPRGKWPYGYGGGSRAGLLESLRRRKARI